MRNISSDHLWETREFLKQYLTEKQNSYFQCGRLWEMVAYEKWLLWESWLLSFTIRLKFPDCRISLYRILVTTWNPSAKLKKRENGLVGTVDLTKAFDTIDHEIILRNMWYLGVDQAAIKCFSSYLSGRTQGCIVSGKLSSARTLSCGVPQGSILGPLLFIIYIHDLPNSLRGAVPRMFADDTNLTLSAKTLTELKLALTPELNNLSCWLKANKLSLNVAKTELMIIGSRQRLSAQCDDVEIRIDDQIIKRVDHTKSLGLTIDAQLSWGKHVEEICKKVSSAIGALKRVRPFISKETAIQIYNGLIMPHFDYCSPVWDCLSGYLSDKHQNYRIVQPELLLNHPLIRDQTTFSPSSTGGGYIFDERNRKSQWYTKPWMTLLRNIFKVFSLSVTLPETLREGWPCPNQALIIWNEASLTPRPCYGITYPKA